MENFLNIYAILLLIGILAVIARIMTRRAIVVSIYQIFFPFAIAVFVPLLLAAIGMLTSLYDLSLRADVQSRSLIIWMPVFCSGGILGLIFVFYMFLRSTGDVILINVDEQLVFDSIQHILEKNNITYDSAGSQFLLDDGKGLIQVITRMKSSLSFLQFANTKKYLPVMFDGLKKDLRDYRSPRIPWLALALLLPCLPFLSILSINVPGLKNILEFDLSFLGELPRIVGENASWGTYLTGQISGLALLLLSVRVWIKKPLIITPMMLRVVVIVFAVHMLFLFLTSLSNYTVNLVLLVLCLAAISFVIYYWKIAEKHYSFMNVSPSHVSDALNEVLARQSIPFSESRYGPVLQDGTKIELQTTRPYTRVEIDEPRNHKDFIKEFLATLKKKPPEIAVVANFWILFFALAITTYWFLPYLFKLFFR